jgi:hypothetical protein
MIRKEFETSKLARSSPKLISCDKRGMMIVCGQRVVDIIVIIVIIVLL